MKYAHDFTVLYFVGRYMYIFSYFGFLRSFAHILKGCFTGSGEVIAPVPVK